MKLLYVFGWMPMPLYRSRHQSIELRVMSLGNGKIHVLFRLIGGSGTMNVPSWAPDSKHLAFVSYQLLPAEDDAGSP